MVRRPRTWEKAVTWWYKGLFLAGTYRASEVYRVDPGVVSRHRRWRRQVRNHGESTRYCGGAGGWCPLHSPYRVRARRRRAR
jgi:hypothetical protein